MFKILLVCFLVVGVSVPAWASIAQPTALIEQSVTPTCIKVERSLIVDEPEGKGSLKERPAIQLKNECTSSIIITDIHADYSEVLRVVISDRLNSNQNILFATNDANCKIAEIKTENARLKVSQSHEDRRKNYPYIYRNPIIACKKFHLPIGSTLIFPTPYGTVYSVSGYADKSTDNPEGFDISVRGKMINPEEKN